MTLPLVVPLSELTVGEDVIELLLTDSSGSTIIQTARIDIGESCMLISDSLFTHVMMY